MNFIRHLCKDTFDKCLVMLHPKQENKDTHGYSNVSHEMQEDVFHNEEEEDDDDFAAWPSQKTEVKASVSTNQTNSESPKAKDAKTNKNQSVELDSPSKEKRPMLIGNLDEESLPKKKEQVNDKDEELFAQMNMTLGATPNVVLNKMVIDNKKAGKSADTKDRLDKFKMDEELEPAEGWIDENEIQI